MDEQSSKVAELRGMLLWLRNHYDVGSKFEKKNVLAVVDAYLGSVSVAELTAATRARERTMLSYRQIGSGPCGGGDGGGPPKPRPAA